MIEVFKIEKIMNFHTFLSCDKMTFRKQEDTLEVKTVNSFDS